MERKNNIFLLFMFLAVLLLAGCKSSKTATGMSKAHVEQMKSLPAVSGGLKALSAKMKISVNAGGKPVSSSGNLKVQQGTGVQLSITPLGIFEAARVEFLPQSVQYINKMEGHYSQVQYSDVPLLNELGLGYPLLESVFLNTVYIPSGMSADEFLARASVKKMDGAMVITTTINGITYEYHIDEASGSLVKSSGTCSNGTSVSCSYGGFQSLGERSFPTSMELVLGGTGKAVTLAISLSRMKEGAEVRPSTPSSSYKKVAPAALLKLLGGK